MDHGPWTRRLDNQLKFGTRDRTKNEIVQPRFADFVTCLYPTTKFRTTLEELDVLLACLVQPHGRV
jgi:hypothetical protein